MEREKSTSEESHRFQSMSTASRMQAQSQATQETLVFWYKSHHNGGLLSTLKTVHTEASDNEYIIDQDRYQFRFPFSLCNPYARCYMCVKRIRAYRHYLQNKLEDVFKALRWIDLPGGQDRVAVERNYLMNYIWLMSFIISEVDTTNKDTARHIRFRLENLLVQAENLGVVLQGYFSPLQVLAQNHSYVEDMGDLLQYRKIPRPRAEKKILRLAIKPDTTMLSGNKVQDFNKLLIYVRKDCQVWTKFRSLTESDKVDIVTKGLMEITDTLKDLKGLIKKPLRAIKAGGGSCPYSLYLPAFVSQVQQMKKEIKHIVTSTGNNLDGDDRSILEALLNEVVTHYGYILKFGELLVEEIWDIILMVRMSYVFIRDNPLNSINAASYEAVLLSKFRKGKIKKFLKPSNFSPEDFYKADCPDTLRKLPVVVYPANAEMSLHLQGHRNSNRSKISTPAHKFSLKKRVSGGSKLPVESVNTPTNTNPQKLMFVSEGGY